MTMQFETYTINGVLSDLECQLAALTVVYTVLPFSSRGECGAGAEKIVVFHLRGFLSWCAPARVYGEVGGLKGHGGGI